MSPFEKAGYCDAGRCNNNEEQGVVGVLADMEYLRSLVSYTYIAEEEQYGSGYAADEFLSILCCHL